jgi:beta-phosphoglucomutase
MNNVQACIFDLDGVIVDTAKYHYLAWKRLAKELGFDFTLEDNERLKGVSRMDSLNILLSIGGIELCEEEKETLANKKNLWYVDYISKLSEDEILTGVLDFFEILKENNIKIALGSASKNSMLILKNLKLVEYFDAIVDGNKVSKAKPDPEVFLRAAEELSINPKNCVVFEDSEAGIEAALNAGMKTIGIGTPVNLAKANKCVPNLAGATISLLSF